MRSTTRRVSSHPPCSQWCQPWSSPVLHQQKQQGLRCVQVPTKRRAKLPCGCEGQCDELLQPDRPGFGHFSRSRSPGWPVGCVSHLPGEAAHCRHAQVYHHPRRRMVLQTVAAYKWAARSLPSPPLSMSSLGPWPSALQTCHPLAQIRVPSLLPFAELFPGHLEHL